jgi:hypothetical protein
MGPTERSLRSTLDLIRDGGYDPRGGTPVPIEEIHAANFISKDQYLAILKEIEQDRRSFARRMAEEEMGAESEMLAGRLRRSGFPRRFVDAAIDRTRNAELAQGRWLYVQGGDVEAVTRKATSIAKGWLAEQQFGTVAFVRSTTMVSGLVGEGAADLMTRLCWTGLLVLSGLGAESASPWASSKVGEVLDVRYGAELPVVVTSRHRPDDLARHLGDRADAEGVRGIMDLLRRQSTLVLT